MLIQTFKKVFNIQGTATHPAVDKSYSIYILITERIPLTNHTQIEMIRMLTNRISLANNIDLIIRIAFN